VRAVRFATSYLTRLRLPLRSLGNRRHPPGGYAFVNLDVSFITPNTASAAVAVVLAQVRVLSGSRLANDVSPTLAAPLARSPH